MPYKNDPRRTVTLNLYPPEYAALADDALQAGYATPGRYALAVLLDRGEPPAPVRDERGREREEKLLYQNSWLLAQVNLLTRQLRQAGLDPGMVPLGDDIPQPRSLAAQRRAVRRAVEKALADERAAVARQAATPPTPRPPQPT